MVRANHNIRYIAKSFFKTSSPSYVLDFAASFLQAMFEDMAQVMSLLVG